MSTQPSVTVEPAPSVITVAHIVYALHTLSLVIGALGAASIIGMFIFGWPSIIAVILNYVKRADARGTWVESHFRWQIRTFWFALLWVLVVGFGSLLLTVVAIGFVTWPLGMIFLGLWAVYRIARGWMNLRDGRPMVFAP